MGKQEKKSRAKRLTKQVGILLERVKEHRIKAETQKGSKDTTPEYWRKEAENFEKQAKEKEEIIKKLQEKKDN